MKNSIVSKLSYILKKTKLFLFIKLHEKKSERIKYIYLNNGTNTLYIIFSAFDKTDKQRKYNYVKSFKTLNIDLLFLSDPFGYRGSYYLRECGDKLPERQVDMLLKPILANKNYSHVITMGTSKGGTAALYYGLKLGVDEIVVGACQYRLGNYLSNYPRIFKGMMGCFPCKSHINILDRILPEHLKKHKDTKTFIHLIHSKQEVTYEDDEKYLIADLNHLGFNWKENEYGFKEHSEVGKYFIPYVKALASDSSRKL